MRRQTVKNWGLLLYIVNMEAVEFKEYLERGARGVKRKTLVDDSSGSKRFYLRYYRLEPGGQTPFDIHDYEHIVVITKGRGSLLTMNIGHHRCAPDAVLDAGGLGQECLR